MGYKANNRFRAAKIFPVLCCVSMLFLNGCATTNTVVSSQHATANEVDPLEDFNRDMFAFNELLDEYVAEPVVTAYNWATPHFVQTGIGNFFSNLKDVNVVLNDLLQGKILQGGEDTGRFLLNSTVGLGGLFDVASEVGLEKHHEDFDQTFAVWGVPQGPYLVLPVLGPTTGRGIGGTILDTAANPATYVGYPIQALSLLNERANAGSALKLIDEAALDRYVFTRDAYLQARKNLIKDGKLDNTDDGLEEEILGDNKKSSISADSVNLNSKTENPATFKQASDAFSNSEKSFDKTSQTLKATSDKLDQLSQ